MPMQRLRVIIPLKIRLCVPIPTWAGAGRSPQWVVYRSARSRCSRRRLAACLSMPIYMISMTRVRRHDASSPCSNLTKRGLRALAQVFPSRVLRPSSGTWSGKKKAEDKTRSGGRHVAQHEPSCEPGETQRSSMTSRQAMSTNI